MLKGNPWLPILHNNGWSTNPSTVASDMNSTVVVVDIYADKFAEASSSSELAKLSDEFGRVARQSDNSPIHVHDEGMWSVYLCSCR